MSSAIRMRQALLLAIGLGAAAAMPSRAADPCSQFSWDVARERALFAGTATAVLAGTDAASAPRLLAEHLYELQLRPLDQVRFVATPGRQSSGQSAYAGLATLRITAPGRYRIAVDAPFWIDVVADGGLMSVAGFQGAPDCNAPHKILEFEFAVVRELTLQFSGDRGSRVRVGIVAVAGR